MKNLVTKGFALSFFLLLTLSSCNKITETPSKENSSSVVPTPAPTSEVADEYAGVDKFIDEFNAIADNDITSPQKIDIHSDEHYRTEFRLGAFNNAVAKDGISGQAYLEMVNYGALSPTDFRVYVSAESYESFQSTIETCAKVFDSEITKELIQEKVYDLIEENNVLSNSFSFYLNDVNCTYKRTDDAYTFMMDQVRAPFL